MGAGHARGAGDAGASGTFLVIQVDGDSVTFNANRNEHDGIYNYRVLIRSGTLYDSNTTPPVDIHFQDGASPHPGYSGTLDTVLAG